MQCPQCRYEMQPDETECPRCARLTAEGKGARANPVRHPADAVPHKSPLTSRIIYWVAILLIPIALYIFTNPNFRPYFSSPNVIYRGTVSTGEGEILLIGASIRSLDNSEEAAQHIIEIETAEKKYAGIEVGFYPPHHVPTRHFSVDSRTVESDIKDGTAGMIFSLPATGLLSQRPKGQPLKYAPAR